MKYARLTRKQAAKLGWAITEGAYQGTSDDRLGRYYWDKADSDGIDRRGPGYATIADALDALSRYLAEPQ